MLAVAPVLFLSLTLISACSSFSGNRGKNRSLNIGAQWIRQIHQDESLSSHKISRSRPLLYKDLVIAGSSLGGISAFSRKDGAMAWHFPVEGGVEASPALAGVGQVVLGGKDGYIYSLSAATGEMNWKFFAKAEVLSDLRVDDDSVYFLSGANVLYSLDYVTGRQRWVYSRVQSNQFSIRGGAQALVKGDRVYAGFSDGFLVALNRQSGELIWERRLALDGKFADVDTSPTTDGERIYAASFDGAFYAFEENGALAWRVDLGAFSRPQIIGNRILLSGSDRHFYVLDRSSGKVLKQLPLRSVASTAMVHENSYFLSESGGDLLVYDSLRDEVIARYAPGAGSLSEPVYDEEYQLVYVNSHAGNLHAVALRYLDRSLKWDWER